MRPTESNKVSNVPLIEPVLTTYHGLLETLIAHDKDDLNKLNLSSMETITFAIAICYIPDFL